MLFGVGVLPYIELLISFHSITIPMKLLRCSCKDLNATVFSFVISLSIIIDHLLSGKRHYNLPI